MKGFEDKRSLKALHVRLDRNSGLPTRGNPHGNGASIVLVGVTPYQGAWESQVQGSAPLMRVIARCGSATPLVSKWLKQHLTFTPKGLGEQ